MTLHAPAPDKLGTKVRDEQYRSPVGPRKKRDGELEWNVMRGDGDLERNAMRGWRSRM